MSVHVHDGLYRGIAGSFPTGVAVVTTVDADGIPKGLTTQSFVALSTEPPLMMIAIDKGSRTLAALNHAKALVINLLKFGSEDVATRFASKDVDKFHGLHWDASGVAGGAPILRDFCVAFAECRVTETIEAGDHWIFIGRLERGEVLGGIPLMYYRRTYAAWPEERPAPDIGGVTGGSGGLQVASGPDPR